MEWGLHRKSSPPIVHCYAPYASTRPLFSLCQQFLRIVQFSRGKIKKKRQRSYNWTVIRSSPSCISSLIWVSWRGDYCFLLCAIYHSGVCTSSSFLQGRDKGEAKLPAASLLFPPLDSPPHLNVWEAVHLSDSCTHNLNDSTIEKLLNDIARGFCALSISETKQQFLLTAKAGSIHRLSCPSFFCD